jgi:glycosyltransferase involved in cell wall biosynthesis
MYGNPGMYPPTQSASAILAEAGWQVRVLGITAPGVPGRLRVPTRPGLKVANMTHCPPGWKQKIHFLAFCLWVLATVFWWRPRWVYLSDPFVTGMGYLLKRWGVRVVYHEHDGPPTGPLPLYLKLRGPLARRADLCVLPAAGRVAVFVAATGRQGSTVCVNNCPRRMDAQPPKSADGDRLLTLIYSGSIGEDRIPEAVIRALTLAPQVRFVAVGYEIRDVELYIPHLKRLAAELGVADRVTFLPGRPRAEVWPLLAAADVGLSVRPMTVNDPNFVHMVGATNKAFDYFAAGLPLLVSDLPEWTQAYVAEELALACDPDDPVRVAAALNQFAADRQRTRAMGERGRQRVLTDWNYETQFEPVKRILEAQ